MFTVDFTCTSNLEVAMKRGSHSVTEQEYYICSVSGCTVEPRALLLAAGHRESSQEGTESYGQCRESL